MSSRYKESAQAAEAGNPADHTIHVIEMNNLSGVLEDIVRELTRLDTVPVSERPSEDDFFLPRMIDAGSGNSLIISRKLDEDITQVAQKLMDDDATLKPKFTQAEWRAVVRRAFGPALATIDLDDAAASNASKVLAIVKATIERDVSVIGIREFTFGCTLFENTKIQPFSIGPVLFEPRENWLARKHLENGITTMTRNRIVRTWQGKKLRKRKSSFDSISEKGILEAIGGCAFVCSVTTQGLAAEAGREKALTAARLATVVIALIWQTPSKALEGINLVFDRKPHQQKAITFLPGRHLFIGSSWSHRPFAPPLKAGEWEKILADRKKILAVVGDVLAYVISPSGGGSRPNMMSALAHALLWFHEGCRERVTHMAIVNFAASMDALADGRKSGGIQRLIGARLGIQADKPIRAGGPTLKQAIQRIYGDGRSRTIHGKNDEFGNDWSDTKALAEQFARLCLIFCLGWVADNPTSDDPKQLSA